jgi:glycosyl transferase family 25
VSPDDFDKVKACFSDSGMDDASNPKLIMANQVDIVVISLRESCQRRIKSAEQLDSTKLSWSFFDAVDGRKLPLPAEYDRRARLKYSGVDMVPGQIGCFLSHRECWKKCVQTQRLMLVLEDDFHFQQDLAEVMPIAMKTMANWDILRLQGVCSKNKYKVLENFGRNQLVKHYHDSFGTTAYLVKPEIAKILLAKSVQFHAHIDDFFSHDWIHRLNILSILPYPVKPSGDPTTIGSCDDDENNRLCWREKWRTKLFKLPRSVDKRFYRMRTFLSLYFTPTRNGATRVPHHRGEAAA